MNTADLLTVPSPQETAITHAAALQDTEGPYLAAAQAHALALAATAGHLVRHMLPAAAVLAADLTPDDEGLEVTLLTIRDAGGHLLWANRRAADSVAPDHPDITSLDEPQTAHLFRTMDRTTKATLKMLLRRAYLVHPNAFLETRGVDWDAFGLGYAYMVTFDVRDPAPVWVFNQHHDDNALWCWYSGSYAVMAHGAPARCPKDCSESTVEKCAADKTDAGKAAARRLFGSADPQPATCSPRTWHAMDSRI